MNSKKALENITTAPSFMGGNPRYWTCLESRIPFLEDIETVKKDLDRLDTFDYIVEQNVKLKEENDKLKKAIKILTDKTIHFMFLKRTSNIEIYNECSDTYNYDNLTQEEYNLLREVLGHDR